jgi:hypothetical protein
VRAASDACMLIVLLRRLPLDGGDSSGLLRPEKEERDSLLASMIVESLGGRKEFGIGGGEYGVVRAISGTEPRRPSRRFHFSASSMGAERLAADTVSVEDVRIGAF